MKSQLVWLSYDLGIRGEYETLYAWLDEKKAKECGDSIAVFNYKFHQDLKAEMKKELEKILDTSKPIRIYLILTIDGKQKGTFLFGGRKAAPWSGYSQAETEDD